jgi:spore maturation protein CgeB
VRILIVDTCYPAFVAAHYARSPGLDRRPYDEQWRALMGTFFGTADSYSHFLAAAGHQAHEVVVDCEPLQRAWEAEHGRRRRRFGRARPQVLDQADWFEADVVYVQNLNVLGPRTLRRLGRRRLLVGQIASELPEPEQLRPFDLVLTSFPHFVDRLRRLGPDSAYFRIGFDPRVLDHVDTRGSREGARFVGALRHDQHGRGNELLARASLRAPIDFWGYGVDGWPGDSPVKRRYRGEAWGLEMYRVLAGAKVALNRHIDVAEDYANNMRLYEATGVGALLLTDAKRNLGELFAVGREVVAYEDADDLAAKIEHYLEHEDERASIARAGHERTLGEHSYEARMRELADILSRRPR